MSRLYEALLRAEMERVAESNRSSEEGSTAAVSSLAAPTPLRTIAAAEADESKRPSSQADAVASEGTSVAAFHPRAVEWHPDEARLQSMQSRGILVEQIRALRSRLHELRQERPLKTVLISSGVPQEGKSFVAANLAVGLASFRNRRILLIDGDMRRGTLHRLLGAPQQPGLTDYLANKASLSDVMQRMQTPKSGPLHSLASLTFIPSGHDADNAADLSGNGRFEALLRSVYDEFDWIVVDSSPVTPVADGVNLARACDGVVLVVRGGVTKYEIAQRAQQELKATNIVGVVLNAVEGAPLTGGYYGYDS